MNFLTFLCFFYVFCNLGIKSTDVSKTNFFVKKLVFSQKEHFLAFQIVAFCCLATLLVG